MKTLLVSLTVLLASCSWTESDAGKARYTYTVTTADGARHEIDLRNAKDIGLISATVKYGDIEVELIEQGVNASGPMAIMAEQNGALIQKLIDTVPTP